MHKHLISGRGGGGGRERGRMMWADRKEKERREKREGPGPDLLDPSSILASHHERRRVLWRPMMGSQEERVESKRKRERERETERLARLARLACRNMANPESGTRSSLLAFPSATPRAPQMQLRSSRVLLFDTRLNTNDAAGRPNNGVDDQPKNKQAGSTAVIPELAVLAAKPEHTKVRRQTDHSIASGNQDHRPFSTAPLAPFPPPSRVSLFLALTLARPRRLRRPAQRRLLLPSSSFWGLPVLHVSSSPAYARHGFVGSILSFQPALVPSVVVVTSC